MNGVKAFRDPLSEQFIKILRVFLAPSQDFHSVFSYPTLSESQINEVKKMLEDGVSISGCCCFLSFDFDPALPNAIRNHQIPNEENKIGKISSTISFIGSDKFCTSDFFLLMVFTLFSNFDQTSQFCLKLITNHYLHNTPKELSPLALNEIIKYFLANNDILNYEINILTDFLKIAHKTKNNNIVNTILRTFLTIIQNNSEKLLNFDFKELLNNLLKFIQNLNIDAISLLVGIVNFSNTTYDFPLVFKQLARDIIVTFSENGTKLKVKKLTPTTDFFSDFIIDYQLNFDSFKYFPHVTNVLPNSNFDSSLTVSEILTEQEFEVMKTLQAVFHLFQDHLQNLTLDFFTSYAGELLEHQCVETLYFYLYLIENTSYVNDDQKMLYKVIVDSEIFSPEFTLFYNDKDDFQVLNTLRNLAMNVIYTSCPSLISVLNSTTSKYPFLFVENYSRLRTFVPVTDMIQFLNNPAIYHLTLVLKKLVEKMSEDELDQQDRNRVFSAWSTLFVCITDLLNDRNSIVILFQSFDFTNNFIRHIFNPTLRPFVFSTLQRYMTMNNASLSTIAQFCLYTFSYALYNDDKKYHELMIEILGCLEDAIAHNPSILREMSVITPALLSFFIHFPTKELLKNTLNFLLLVSFNVNNFIFSHEEMLSLGNTIRKMDKNELSENNFSIILSLLAGCKITNLTQDFTIKNPSFIMLVMYVKSDDLLPIIQFFYRLCQCSVFNCIQCHKGKLDLLMIELIHSYPEPFNFLDCTFNSSFSKEELLDVVFPFLGLIFTYQCSQQSVERFIGLSVPKLINIVNTNETEDNKKDSSNQSIIENYEIFSKYAKCSVTFPQFSDNVMNSIINTCTNIHNIDYIYEPSASPITTTISLNDITNGFSFSFYLMIDSMISQHFSQKQILLRMYDDYNFPYGNSFLLYLSRSNMLCEINKPSLDKSTSVSLMTDIPSCQWELITVTYQKLSEDDDKALLTFSLNKDSRPPYKITDTNFIGPNLTVQIGGFNEEVQPINEAPCFLSSFHLFNSPLSNKQVESLFSFGSTEMNSSMKDLLTKNNSNDLHSYIKPFSYVFNRYDLFKLMIPFFGFSKSSPHFFLEKIVDTFRHVDKGKYENYICLISQFLMNSPPDVICYSLYLHFFMLFSENQSSVLFKQILFNFDIWFNAEDPQTVKRTVQHWSNALFVDFSQFFTENTCIPEILTLIRIHCWYTDEKNNNHINRKRCKNIDVNYIRNCLNRLLSEFASFKLTMDDVRSILSNTFTTHDIQHKLSFLSLLDNISSLITNKSEVSKELHFLLITSIPELFITTLNLILKLSEESLDLSSSNSDNINNKNIKLSASLSSSNRQSGSSVIFRTNSLNGKPSSLTTNYFQNSLNSTSASNSISFVNKEIVTSEYHIECILFLMNKQHFTVPFLDAVLGTSNRYPEVMPIACMIACNLSETEKLKAANTFTSLFGNEEDKSILNNQLRIEYQKFWFVWPIILTLAITTSKEVQVNMLKTIVSVVKNNFATIDQILGFLDLIYIKFGFKVTTFQLVILDIVSSKFTENSKKETKTMIYRFVRNLLFHFDNNIHSTKLIQEFKNSPFNNNLKEFVDDSTKQLHIYQMKDIQDMLSDIKNNEIIFRVDLDDENLYLFERIINNFEKFNLNLDKEDNLTCYINFIKYLRNKSSINGNDKCQILQNFAHEGWRNFQAMSISFKVYMNSLCVDFEKFLAKTESNSKELLLNVNEESIKSTITSIDKINDRRINQFCQAANMYNEFESLEMNEISIWKDFNSFLTKKVERMSFTLLDDFSCPFTKKVYKMFKFEIDPFIEKTIPIMKCEAKYISFTSSQSCIFAVLPKKILIATKLKIINIQITDINCILYRSVNCYEFVKKNGKTYLVNFLHNPIEEIIKSIKQVINSNFNGNFKSIFQTSTYSKFIHNQNITNDWVNRKITTFEYLLKLNFFGGRSYKMLSNYPIFPLIRDFNDNKVTTKVSPSIWLEMFQPFNKCFYPIEATTIDLPLTNKSVEDSTGILNDINSNSNEIPIDDDNSNLYDSSNKDDDDFANQNSYSEFLTSSLISKERIQNANMIESAIREKADSHLFLSTLQSSKFELTPEFYTMPDCFRSLKLPPGVSNEYEFIYENRKKLESEEVSKTLNVWIDRFFGFCFKGPHPTRNPRTKLSNNANNSGTNYQLFLTISQENLLFGKIISHKSSSDKLSVKTVSVDGFCREHQIDILKQTVETSALTQLTFSSNAIISSCCDEILFIDSENAAFSVSRGTPIVKTQLDCSVDFIEGDAVFGSNEGFVFGVERDVKRNGIRLLGKSKVSPELIVTMTSSRKFNRTAVSVHSGKIILFERNNGRFLRIIDTGGIPAKRLIFTEGTGLIVAEFPFELALFSMTGQKIRTMKILYEIFYLSSFVSEDGFDYLFVSDKYGQIMIIEAFTFKIVEKSSHKINTKIIDICYVASLGSLLILTQDGKLFSFS